MSWNVHRLSTLNAIDILRNITHNTSADVVLLQEAGSWDKVEFENGCSWRLFPNAVGHRDVAVLLSQRLAPWAAWWDSCYYGVAVLVLSGGVGSKEGCLYVSCHLPDRSESDDTYAEAILCLSSMLKRVPSEFIVLLRIVGFDANVELCAAEYAEPYSGPHATGSMWDDRSVMFVEFLQSWELLAANTWHGDVSLITENSDILHEQIVTHRLYSTGARRQIDFVCCSIGIHMCCRVLDGLRELALTDHWPLLLCFLRKDPGPSIEVAVEIPVEKKPHHAKSFSSRKGWQPTSRVQRQHFNKTFRESAAIGDPACLQNALKNAINDTQATTIASRRAVALQVPVDLVELRGKFQFLPEGTERRDLARKYAHSHRKWIAQKHAIALDRQALSSRRDAGKSRRVPDSISFRGEPCMLRAQWPSEFARKYEMKCNRSQESPDTIRVRLLVLVAQGLREQDLVIGMTTLLQALAAMACNKGVARDGVPADALKCLDWHSFLMVLNCFEKRLNAKEGYTGTVDDWQSLVAQFIPKGGGVALELSDSWRAVLVGSSLMKWYLSCLMLFAQLYLERMPPFIMGFRRGFQTAMLIEPLRVALLLAAEWDLPLAVGCCDVDSAFESMSHIAVVAGWQALGAPTLLIAAFYREMAGAEAEVVVCGLSTENGSHAQLIGGGRPGDVATPAHWNVVVHYILRLLVPSWVARGFGFRFGEALLLLLCWADDFTVVASSIMQLRIMLRELAEVFLEHGLHLKASKCNWFANTAAWKEIGTDSFIMRVDINAKVGARLGIEGHMAHLSVPFQHKETLVVLGACLAPDADADVAMKFALSRGMGHWIQRRKALCRRRVLLCKRVRRYYSTVGATVLHGLEGLPLTQKLLGKVMSFDRRNLRSMLCLRKLPDETWKAYTKRQNTLLRKVMGGMCCMELAARLLAKQHGWAGHVTRLDRHHVAAQWACAGTLEDWHLKQAVYSNCDAANTTGWRHKSKGPKTHWESNLARVFGDQWRTLALDRRKWRASKAYFICECCDALMGSGASPIGVVRAVSPDWSKVEVQPVPPSLVLNELLPGISGGLLLERGVARAALSSLTNKVTLQVVGDSKFLIDCVLGRASATDPTICKAVRLAHVALENLIRSFKAEPPPGQELACHVPRNDNAAADAVANWSLDSGSFMEVSVSEVYSFLHCLSTGQPSCTGFLFSFDGASRGNPGASSSGVCVWWGSWHFGEFHPQGLLLQKGARLGTGTNNTAESHGLVTAFKTAVRLYYWVTEQIAELARHSQRDE